VPRVRDLLYRFRPAGTPGPASSAAVPVDRAADRAAELAPVFLLLGETEAGCARIVAEAERDARRIREGASRSAHLAEAAARSAAPGERAGAAASVAAAVADETSAIVETARLEADGLRRRADLGAPGWVARVVGEVEDLLGAPTEAGRP